MKCHFPLILGKTFFLHKKKLSLGEELEVDTLWRSYPNCVFIKVTRKGFNILNIDSNRVILNKHLYGCNMKNKEYPSRGEIRITCRVPSFLKIKRKNFTDQKIS